METLERISRSTRNSYLEEHGLSKEEMTFLMQDVESLYFSHYLLAAASDDETADITLHSEPEAAEAPGENELIFQLDGGRELVIARVINSEKTFGGYGWWVESRVPIEDGDERWVRFNLWAGGAHVEAEGFILLGDGTDVDTNDPDIIHGLNEDEKFVQNPVFYGDYCEMKALLLETETIYKSRDIFNSEL